jgi:hypothetical protein
MFLTKKENIMAYLFTPPTVDQGPAGAHWLFYRYTLKRGITVYKIDNQWYEEQYPWQDDLDQASVVYLGGHEYYVSLAEKNALQADGYTVSTV